MGMVDPSLNCLQDLKKREIRAVILAMSCEKLAIKAEVAGAKSTDPDAVFLLI